MMYSSWDTESDRQDFFSFGTISTLLTPTHHPWQPIKSKFWKNEKNAWRFYYFIHVYHNDNHMMYVSWDMECNKHNFLSFWANFCSFMPLTTRKIKLLKEWKNTPGDNYHLTHFITWCMVPYILSATDRIFCHFGPFCPFTHPPNNPKLFYTSVSKIMIICYTVPKIWHIMDIIFIFHFWLFFALLPT